MENYGQYSLDHFYKKSYRDGGLTMGQITTLYEHSIKRMNDKYKFLAAINGIDLDKDNESKSPSASKRSKSNDLTFKDPSEYEHMSDEEKEELTKKMKAGHLNAINSSGFGK